MDNFNKRFIIFIIFSTLMIILYQTLLTPKKPPLPPQKVNATTNTTTTTTISKETPFEFPPQKPKKTQTMETKQYVVTYSKQGGYIYNSPHKIYNYTPPAYNLGYIPQHKDIIFDVVKKGDKLLFYANKYQLYKEFAFEDDNSVSIKINIPYQKETEMVLFSNSLSNNWMEKRYQELFFSKNNKIKRYRLSKVKSQILEDIDFIGIRDRYFVVTLTNNHYKKTNNHYKKIKILKQGHNNVYIIGFLSPEENTFSLYLGPQKQEKLKPFGLEKIVNYGFFHPISVLLLKILYFFHSISHSWGFSIILLAILIYFILFPFTLASTRSMKKLMQIQPQIEKLKTKYQGEPQKLQKEIMELYKKNKVNPLGGCLPLLFQLPVFIALYRILWRLVDLKGQGFLWIKDLTEPDKFLHFSFLKNIPLINGNINLLPLLMLSISLLQQKFVYQKGESQQKSMGLFMSIFIGIIFYNFPSGLVLYWLTQNILTFIYQFRVMKNT